MTSAPSAVALPGPAASVAADRQAPIRLALFFTRGMSLRAWDDLGMLDREMALYVRLQALGVDVTFVTYGGPEEVLYEQRFPGIHILSNVTGLSPDTYEASIEHLHVGELEQIDVIKTNQMQGADVALRVARHLGIPLIARCGYMLSAFVTREQGADSVAARAAMDLERTVFSGADRIVVTTPEMAADIQGRIPESGGRVRIIPNYVDTDLFSPAAERSVRWDLLFVGRLVPQKNLATLLDAVAALPVRMAIIGEGPLEPALRGHPASLEGKVDWLGAVPSRHLPEYMRRSRICVLPSLYEGHPKVLIEAMACGRPVVGTDVPGIRELISHGKTGWLCVPAAQDLEAAIRRLLSDADLCVRLGRAARAFVLDTCSLDRAASQEHSLLCTYASREGRTQNVQSGLPQWRSALDGIPDDRLASEIGNYLTARAMKLPPDKGLRLLFQTEDVLYPAEGDLAVRYGGGVHTKHRHIRYHDFFLDRVHRGERILDIGCGNGAVAFDLAVRGGARVFGVDLNEQNIHTARTLHDHPDVHYAVGDATAMEPGDPVDVVVLSNVLEHIADRRGLLRRIRRVIKPMRILLRVPLFERDWRIPLRRELGIECRLDPTHETEYSVESFVEELRVSGYTLGHLEVRWGEIWAEARPKAQEVSDVPAVSVVMSTHNDAAYLPLAVESIMQQTFQDYEFIIIDDASTDGTPEILQAFTDPRIRVSTHREVCGLTRTLNEAVAMARGCYIARMDGDDISLPARFERQVALLDAHPEIGMVGTAYMFITGENTVTNAESVYGADADIRAHLLHRNCFGHGTVMMRKTVFDGVGGYDETYRFAQDYDLWLRIAERSALANIPEALYCWRRTAGNITSRHTDEQEGFAELARRNAAARGILAPRVSDGAMVQPEERR